MNRQLLYILPISLIVAGCAAYAPSGAPTCAAYDPKSNPPCTGDPKTPHVNLNTKKLNATPTCVKAYPGTTITFKLAPVADNKLGNVEIFPKPKAGKWLAGTNNTDKDYIYIKVPKTISFPEDKKKIDFDYGIKTATKCVDPRVRVEAPGSGVG